MSFKTFKILYNTYVATSFKYFLNDMAPYIPLNTIKSYLNHEIEKFWQSKILRTKTIKGLKLQADPT